MIVLKDRFKSCISEKEIKQYKKQAKNSTTNAGKIFPDKTTTEVENAGIALAKKNNRKIVCEETRGL